MTEHDNNYLSEIESGDILERVASRVHDAWWREKEIQGFHPPIKCPQRAPHPAIGKNEAEEAAFTKHCEWCHADMYSYSTLPEHVKEYDRATVRAVFSAMSGEGWLPPEDVEDLRALTVLLDDHGVKRKGDYGQELSLVGRVMKFADAAQQEQDDDE